MDLTMMKDHYPVPAGFKRTRTDDLRSVHEANDKEAWTTAMDWLADFSQYVGARAEPLRRGSSLVLVGPPGTGKTMLASAMLNHITHTLSKTTAYINDGKLDRFLRDARYSRLDDEDEFFMFGLENVACVVVDDALRLGGTAEILEPFLRTRGELGKPTILTINVAVPLSETMRSFLSTWTWAVFTGPDQRRI